VDECATLGIQLQGHETKWRVIDLLLDKAQKTPSAFGQVPNKRFSGLPLPWDETERLPYHANGKRSLTQGAAPEQRLAPALPDPARSERRQYARIVDAKGVADMLVAAHAEDVAILHVGTVCSWTDSMVIATARSEPHLSALAGAAMHFFSQARTAAVAAGDPGAKTAQASLEGQRSSVQRPDWLVVDMDSVVVHMFTREMREEYALEELWGEQHGCRVEYLPQSAQAPGAAAGHQDDVQQGSREAGVREEADGGAQGTGDGRWAPVVYDRRARTFRPFGGGALGSPEGEVPTQAGGGASEAEAEAEAEGDSDTDRDEEADEEQVVALQRYEMAHAVINAREELRQQREDERAAAQRMALAAKAKANRSLVENRRRKAEIRQARKKSIGAEAGELRVKAPSIGMRIRSLRDALAQGVQYGTVLGAADTKHTPGCTCRACRLVAAEADKLASSERGQATLTMAPVAQWTPCQAECSCDTCRWTRQRIQNMVLASVSETARVAGLMHLRLIQVRFHRAPGIPSSPVC
jgi:ribosome silencing factor RsfS/YbeB/iojap